MTTATFRRSPSAPPVAQLDVTGEVVGGLTLIGVTTRQVAIPFEFQGSAIDPDGNQHAGLESPVAVNPQGLGITWNAGPETWKRRTRDRGVPVGDNVTFEFRIRLKTPHPRLDHSAHVQRREHR